jgi:hypothetical protein
VNRHYRECLIELFIVHDRLWVGAALSDEIRGTQGLSYLIQVSLHLRMFSGDMLPPFLCEFNDPMPTVEPKHVSECLFRGILEKMGIVPTQALSGNVVLTAA